jgi:hypothetical protein
MDQQSEDFLIGFLNGIFDELIVGRSSEELAGVDAKTLYALQSAIGEITVSDCLEKLQSTGKIRYLMEYNKAQSRDIVIEILDYLPYSNEQENKMNPRANQ